jgi:hypothetical protein
LIFTGGVAEKFIHVKTQLKYVKKNTYLDITRIQPNPQPVSITQPTQPTQHPTPRPIPTQPIYSNNNKQTKTVNIPDARQTRLKPDQPNQSEGGSEGGIAAVANDTRYLKIDGTNTRTVEGLVL